MRLVLALFILFALAACTSVTRANDPTPVSGLEESLDYSCKIDSDCAIKDIGNCCGRYPACVNRASPTFPDKVKQECERTGMAGVCGFPEIRACRCVEQRCSAVNGPGGNGEIR